MSVASYAMALSVASALIGMGQNDLAASSGARSTIGAFEIKDEHARLMGANNRTLIEAFEQAGLEFIPENEGGGLGIRLRHPSHRSPDADASSRAGSQGDDS
ncbi:helix-turn-helix domain-containing protein [Microvirga sp. P5_D2]